MASIEEVQLILDEIAEELPPEIYKDLNGGIILLPQIKLHKKSVDDDLYVMGEYRHEMISGRYIVVYYGSVEKLFGNLSRNRLKNKLRSVIKHEFIHHLESMAGERHLEIEDERKLAEYLKKK
ncbi:MAG TPA: metallopeptidase family protein [Sedimentibacter sp.]|nr:metallopeptidase family protein [Sedimentibacter sp.]HNZ83428.1 metallopeptidase family protein [Sedimentibacter sp.]HOH69309.1 metallopeptidase family protein [Sedimentibacter sp.]HPW99387.1 metallopeptidase family protein [Sedimentibacter sp.]HQB62832.1 metallopeptidase family protein [Sedimentibacter sp.]